MSSRGTGLTLMLGILAAIVGYVMFQLAIGMDTKVDDIPTILANSSSSGANLGIALILIAVGLTIHAAGIMNTRGTAAERILVHYSNGMRHWKQPNDLEVICK